MYFYFRHKAPGTAADFETDGTQALEEYYNETEATPEEIEKDLAKFNADLKANTEPGNPYSPIYFYTD